MNHPFPSTGSTAKQDSETINNTFDPESAEIVKQTWSFLTTIAGLLAIVWFLVLRFRFGVRFLSPTKFLLAYIVMGIFLLTSGALTTGIFAVLLDPMRYVVFTLNSPFVLLYLALGGYHMGAIWRRGKLGIPWLSTSFGVSSISEIAARLGIQNSLFTDDFILLRFTEPALAFAISIVVANLHRSLGNFLIVCSVSLLFHNWLVFYQIRDAILDQMDAKIWAEFMQKAMQPGTRKQNIAGLPVVSGVINAPVITKPIDVAATVQTTMHAGLQTKPDFTATVNEALAGTDGNIAIPPVKKIHNSGGQK